MDRISVIVPVYKVEAYLDQCVRSITEQTYKNLEIILVDDGSPDNCPDMCDAWAAQDSRIKVIHKENGGLSDARNAGLAIATGDYIGFVDSDDYIDPAMYQQLLERLTETCSDIAACGVEMVWEDGKTAMLTCPGEVILDNHEAMEAIIRESWLKQPVWYKLYRRGTVAGIAFEKGKCHEDVFWSYQPIARAKRVCVFDTPLYHYRQRAGSIMGARFSEKRLDALEAMERRIAFLRQSDPQLADLDSNRLFGHCMYLTQCLLRGGKTADSSRLQARLLQYGKAYRPTIQRLRMLPAGTGLWYALGGLCFTGTCRLRNLLRRGVE